jgi:hypothetical protein
MKRIIALEQKYGTPSASTGRISGGKKSIFNRAIRAELLGGNILLDLNEEMYLLAGQKKWSEECRQLARFCSTTIGNIKNEMLEELERRYTEPVGKELTEKFIEELDAITAAKRLNDDTFDILNYVRGKIVAMLAEMNGEIVEETDAEQDCTHEE